MNPKLARPLTRTYPRSWRERYRAEFEELLETGRGDFRTVVNVALVGTPRAHFPHRGKTDGLPHTGSGRFHSVCVRAPVGHLQSCPLVTSRRLSHCCWFDSADRLDNFPAGGAIRLLAAGLHHGLANLYFQFGKYFYGSAPILVGWAVALLAARQRAKAIWPSTGFVLVARMGAAARIRASRTGIPRGLGHIRMDFVLWPWAHNGHDGSVHALLILSLAVLPYLLWRIHSARTMSF